MDCLEFMFPQCRRRRPALRAMAHTTCSTILYLSLQGVGCDCCSHAMRCTSYNYQRKSPQQKRCWQHRRCTSYNYQRKSPQQKNVLATSNDELLMKNIMSPTHRFVQYACKCNLDRTAAGTNAIKMKRSCFLYSLCIASGLSA